jgi:hypothetical protein
MTNNKRSSKSIRQRNQTTWLSVWAKWRRPCWDSRSPKCRLAFGGFLFNHLVVPAGMGSLLFIAIGGNARHGPVALPRTGA